MPAKWICGKWFSVWQASKILAVPFLNGWSSLVFKQVPSIKIKTAYLFFNNLADSTKAYSLRCKNSFPSLNLYTGIIFNRLNKKRCILFENTSPLAKKCVFLLYLEPIIIASKKELGWLAIINKGPFVFSKYLFLVLISAQKSQRAALIKSFKIVINLFCINIKKPHHSWCGLY